MKNVIFYVTLLLCLVVSDAFSQTFEDRAKAIGEKIEQITKEEKASLKTEVQVINDQLNAGAISPEQADEQKLAYAEQRAANIERRTAAAQEELKKLVQEKVDGTVKSDSVTKFTFRWDRKKNDTLRNQNEDRTTSQFVFAAGLNHLLTDGAMAHSDFRVWGSHFYELGIAFNTRIAKNNNLLHAKYGLSLQYNNLRPTDDRYFVENGNQTQLETSPVDLDDSRLRNVNLVIPVHLEFDFSKKSVSGDKTNFRTHQSFRLGLGGFVGANIRSKQILKFEDDQNNDVTQKTKGDYNVNDLVYGLSAYVGYKEISLYAKYDLNPLFADNAIDQNNISFGVRFDIN